MRWPALIRSKPALWSWLYWLVPVLVVAAAYHQVPWFSFISDDAFLIPLNPHLRGPGALWQNLIHDYFWSASGNFVPYWRPVTKGSWVLEYMVWGDWAGGFHLDQVALHLVATLGVVFFVRRAGGSRAGASVAGLLFGLSPNLVEPTCSVMARSDVGLTAASVWALASWLRWEQTGRRRWGIVHGLALVLAFGSKETSVVLPVVLALWAVIGPGTPTQSSVPAGDGRVEWRRRLSRLLPVVLVVVAYFIGRRAVLGVQQSFPVKLDGARMFLVGGQALFSVLPFHLTAWARAVPKSPWMAPGFLAMATVGWLVLAGALVFAVRKRQRLASVLLVWATASLGPILFVSQLRVPVAPGFFPLAGRWVASATAASAMLVGLALSRMPWARWGKALYAVAALWTLILLALSSATHGMYRDEESLMAVQDEAFLATPPAQRTLHARCDFLERQALRLITARKAQQALFELDGHEAECPDGARFRLLRLGALVDLSRFVEAYGVAESLLRTEAMESRYHSEAYYLAGVAAEATGHLLSAERWLRSARAIGNPSCNLAATLGRLLAATGRLAEGASEYERAARCSGSDPRPRLAAAALWLKAERTDLAAADLASARALPLDAEQLKLVEQLAARLGLVQK